ncbi:hypothetical protein PCASD_13974 [Puccinia coronata f. sp. avenae]|uniref:Uncharacterized protein n=1 Tax=Puccinia coronata f. sp. avenae TaxID=200324 RepID=A0A2N5UCF7_9BASI|nr:hypothetical protein PCASD_13974 [Puccinia coronata f. sp. avenae]
MKQIFLKIFLFGRHQQQHPQATNPNQFKLQRAARAARHSQMAARFRAQQQEREVELQSEWDNMRDDDIQETMYPDDDDDDDPDQSKQKTTVFGLTWLLK